VFVGHYGPAYALQPAANVVPLWVFALAVQWLDLAWSVFILLGIEKAQVLPQSIGLAPLDLHTMPYSHSLVAAVLWAIGFGGIGAVIWRRAGPERVFLALAAAVLSHWVLDFLVHRTDLPLWPGGPEVGLALWNQTTLAVLLELVLLAVGLVLYVRITQPKGMVGEFAPPIVGMLTMFAFFTHIMSPPPKSAAHLAAMALATYAVFIALAAWLDHTREPKTETAGIAPRRLV